MVVREPDRFVRLLNSSHLAPCCISSRLHPRKLAGIDLKSSR
jgi:hypothetical protein